MNLWLCAEEAAGMQTLRLLRNLSLRSSALGSASHRICGVLTTPPVTEHGISIWRVAASAGIPVHDARLVREPGFAAELRRTDADLLLNVHSLHVIDAAVLRAARCGAFNLHPGRLPEYAGLDAASWAIFFDEPTHGVTLHWMAEGIDTGPIALRSSWPSTPEDTALSVNARCVKEGLALIERLLEAAAQDAIPREPQDLSRRRYFARAAPGDGVLQFGMAAARVLARVRACDFHPLPSPFGHPRARVRDLSFGVVKAAATGRPCAAVPGTLLHEPEQVLVACSDHWIALKQLHVGGRYVEAAAFLRDATRIEDGDRDGGRA